MKILVVIFVVLTLGLNGAEIAFRVSDHESPQHESQILLDAFDAFTEVAHAESAPCDVVVDVAKKEIRVRYSSGKSALEMENVLVHAFARKASDRLALEIEMLTARIVRLKEEIAKEKSPVRRGILEQVYVTMLPPLDPPQRLNPLYRIKETPNHTTEPTSPSRGGSS
jgi:hypothetical protein